MNKDLKNDFYTLPEELLGALKNNLHNSSSKENGHDRLNNLCAQKGVNYGQAKKIKHEMENDMSPKAYKLVGGDDLLKWINDSLYQRRKSIDGVKRQKMEAGMPNQFKKSHEKNSGEETPTQVRLARIATQNDEIRNNRTVYEEIKRIKEIIILK